MHCHGRRRQAGPGRIRAEQGERRWTVQIVQPARQLGEGDVDRAVQQPVERTRAIVAQLGAEARQLPEAGEGLARQRGRGGGADGQEAGRGSGIDSIGRRIVGRRLMIRLADVNANGDPCPPGPPVSPHAAPRSRPPAAVGTPRRRPTPCCPQRVDGWWCSPPGHQARLDQGSCHHISDPASRVGTTMQQTEGTVVLPSHERRRPPRLVDRHRTALQLARQRQLR